MCDAPVVNLCCSLSQKLFATGWIQRRCGWGMSSCVKRGRGAWCTWKLVKPWMVLWPNFDWSSHVNKHDPHMSYVHIFQLRACSIILQCKLYIYKISEIRARTLFFFVNVSCMPDVYNLFLLASNGYVVCSPHPKPSSGSCLRSGACWLPGASARAYSHQNPTMIPSWSNQYTPHNTTMYEIYMAPNMCKIFVNVLPNYDFWGVFNTH